MVNDLRQELKCFEGLKITPTLTSVITARVKEYLLAKYKKEIDNQLLDFRIEGKGSDVVIVTDDAFTRDLLYRAYGVKPPVGE